jgi:hypothetical protein
MDPRAATPSSDKSRAFSFRVWGRGDSLTFHMAGGWLLDWSILRRGTLLFLYTSISACSAE